MNPPDLSQHNEITYGHAFHVEPLRGRSYPVQNCYLKDKSLTYTSVPDESEFSTHTLTFHSTSELPAKPVSYLSFHDEDGHIIATLGAADPV